jgi:hypothetical protein
MEFSLDHLATDCMGQARGKGIDIGTAGYVWGEDLAPLESIALCLGRESALSEFGDRHTLRRATLPIPFFVHLELH